MVALFVVATILVFFGVDYLVTRSKAKVPVPVPVRQAATLRFVMPRGYFFSRGHAWVNVLFSGKARVGVDDFVQKIVGVIDSVEPVAAGTVVHKGDPIITLRQGSQHLRVKAPISGRITEINPDVIANPSLVTSDPYENGWIMNIDPEHVGTEVKSLAIADEAAQWLRAEVDRFREFVGMQVFSPAGVTAYDGGLPMQGALRNADEQIWKSFEETFCGNE